MCVTPSIVYFIPLYSQVDYHGSAVSVARNPTVLSTAEYL